MLSNIQSKNWGICKYKYSLNFLWIDESVPGGPVRRLSDRSIISMDRSEIFENSGTGPRSLFSKQMN